MDLANYFSAAVNGTPLFFVVLGLVWWYGKALKLQGWKQFAASLATGVILGTGYLVSTARPPGGDGWLRFSYWFGVGVYGLGLGLLASGLHDASKDLFTKIIAAYAEKILSRLKPPAG